MLISSDLLTEHIKKCPGCNLHLPWSMFNKNVTKANGLASACKDCQRKERKKYLQSLSQSKRREKNQRKVNQDRQYKEKLHQYLGQHLIYYVANAADPSLIKIGYASNFHARIRNLLTGIPKLFLLALMQVDNKNAETNLHWQFHDLRFQGEWFLSKAPLLSHIDSIDQSLALKALPLLHPNFQARIEIPPKQLFIDMAPFLGK